MQTRALGFTLAFSLFAGAAGADEAPSNARLGKKIANVTLTDAAGKPVSLHDLKDSKAIVIVFLSFDCPVSTSYSPSPWPTWPRTYGERGVAFVGVCRRG